MDGEAPAFAFKHGKQPYIVQSSFPCLTAIGITMRQRSAAITAHTFLCTAVARAFNKARDLQEVFTAALLTP